MSDGVIKVLKIISKDEGKIIALMKKIDKTENLKSIRDKNEKITSEHHFCDGKDLIDFELEDNYEIGDLIDEGGKVYIKSTKKVDDNEDIDKSNTIIKSTEKESNETTESKGGKIEENKSNLDQTLLDFIGKLLNSKEELKQKCLKILEENCLYSLNDLLNLNVNDFEIFELPPLIKKRLIEELNKLKPNEELS